MDNNQRIKHLCELLATDSLNPVPNTDLPTTIKQHLRDTFDARYEDDGVDDAEHKRWYDESFAMSLQRYYDEGHIDDEQMVAWHTQMLLEGLHNKLGMV